MFEPRRYFEGADRRKRISDNLEILCSPEFEEIFTKLFGSLGDRMGKPRVYAIRTPDRTKDDIARTNKMRDDFQWKIDDVEVDEEDDEQPYIHEQDVVYAEDEEDDEPAKVPPSIFDMLKSGKEFKDIVPTQPKHTEIYKQAFGLDDNGDPISLPDDEDDEEDDEVKTLSVFIANRLTFLIQTIQPVIFDTSSIEVKDNTMTVAINEEKTFPKITSIDQLGFITCKVNCDPTIQRTIDDFLGDDCFYSSIYCFPTKTVDRHGKDVFAIKFVCYRK